MTIRENKAVAHLLVVGGDVLVPAGDVGELLGVGRGLERVEERRVVAGQDEAGGERLRGERVVEGLEAGVVLEVEGHACSGGCSSYQGVAATVVLAR